MIRNSFYYMTNGDYARLLFGIGWQQPYMIQFDFPFFDHGAWSKDDLEYPYLRSNIQVPLFCVFRDTGLIGLSIVTILPFLLAKSVVRGWESVFSTIPVTYIAYWSLSSLFTFASTSPELLLIQSIVMFAGWNLDRIHYVSKQDSLCWRDAIPNCET